MALIGDTLDSFSKDDRQGLVGRDVLGENQRAEVSQLQLDLNGSSNRSAKPKAGTEGLMVVIISTICFALSVTIALIVTIYFGPPQVPPHGGVVSDSKVCSKLGVKLLVKGGSAVDAAIGTSLCVGLVSPEYSGIGGGGMMIVRSHKANTTDVIDFMDAVPSAGQSVAVPGLLRGLQSAHDKFGKLSWNDIVTSVVLLVDDNGKNIIQSNSMTELLEKIASGGADAFYSGQTAKEVISSITLQDGFVTEEDFSKYHVVHSKPISTTFYDKTVETTSLPSDGPVLLTFLNIMEHLSLNQTNFWNSTELYHYMIEAMKFASAACCQLNEESSRDNATALIISKEFAAQLASRIDPSRTHLESSYYYMKMSGSINGSLPAGNSHISVISPADDMVSVTLTLGDVGGSGIRSSHGFYLNNHLEHVPHRLHTGEHLPAPVSPAIVYSTRTPCAQRLAMGLGDGVFSAVGVADILVKMFGVKLNVTEAMSAGRVYSNVFGQDDIVYYNDGADGEILKMLTLKGHTTFRKLPPGSNNISILSKTNEIVTGLPDVNAIDGNALVY